MAAQGSKSRKQSAANSGSTPPNPALVFFVDRSLGQRVIAERLRQSGVQVEIHDDHFRHDDSQRLRASGSPLDAALPLVAEELQGIAVNLQVAVLATWPDLMRRDESSSRGSLWEWAERVASADAVW